MLIPAIKREGGRWLAFLEVAVWMDAIGADELADTRNSAMSESLAPDAEPVESIEMF